MKAFLNRLLTTFLTATILLFFSEYFFLNEGPVFDLLRDFEQSPLIALFSQIELIFWYMLFTYPFLFAIEYFKVRTVWALFLAAALFGWATEGLIIPAVYEAPPFSFIWTSVGWHVLMNVLLGWYVVRKVIARNSYLHTTTLAVVLGAFWGTWATWFWVGENALPPLTPEEFTFFAWVTGIVWVASTFALNKWGAQTFKSTKFEIGVMLVYVVGLGALTALPFIPFSLGLLPLIAITLFALYRNIAKETKETLLSTFSAPQHITQYAPLFLTPLVASLVYPMYYSAGVGIDTGLVVGLLMLAGTVLFLVALYKTSR